MTSSNYAIVQSNDRITGINKITGETMLEMSANGDVSIGGTLTIPDITTKWATEDILPSVYSPDGSCTFEYMSPSVDGLKEVKAWRMPNPTVARAVDLYWTTPKTCRTTTANTFYLLLGFTQDGVVDATHNNLGLVYQYCWASPTSPVWTKRYAGGVTFPLTNESTHLRYHSMPSETLMPISIPAGTPTVQSWPTCMHIKLDRVNTGTNDFDGWVYLNMAMIKYPVDKLGVPT
jgi:hypothetical protein